MNPAAVIIGLVLAWGQDGNVRSAVVGVYRDNGTCHADVAAKLHANAADLKAGGVVRAVIACIDTSQAPVPKVTEPHARFEYDDIKTDI